MLQTTALLKVTPSSAVTKYQELLHSNLVLLTKLVPPSKALQEMIKTDMFKNMSKATFHHVLHYFLLTLNPTMYREKITSWPIFDVKAEAKFRGEVIAYVTSLDSVYEDSGVPAIMASNLLAPQGIRIFQFLFKFSQLVIRECLSGLNPQEFVQSCPRAVDRQPEVSQLVIKRYKERVGYNESVTSKMESEFEVICNELKSRSDKTVMEHQALNQKLQQCREDIHTLDNSMIINRPLGADELNRKIEHFGFLLEELNEYLSPLLSQFDHCLSVITRLLSSDLTVTVSPPLGHRKADDLLSFFQVFGAFVNQQILTQITVSGCGLSGDFRGKVNDLLKKFSVLDLKLDVVRSVLSDAQFKIPKVNESDKTPVNIITY